MSMPLWFTDQADFTLDQQAYDTVAQHNSQDPGIVHKAARHYNWLRSDKSVQTWTNLAAPDASETCNNNRWASLNAVTSTPVDQATHKRVTWIRDDDLKQRIHRECDDPVTLLKAARRLHKDAVNYDPNGILWLGDKNELDVLQSFTADGVQTLIGLLGLWHYGEVPADASGAILRIAYQLDDKVPRYKPDWRHGYPNFYFACAHNGSPCGMARDLTSGSQHCKEWVVKISDIDPHSHIAGAQYVVPATACNHSEPGSQYWQTLSQEIGQYAKANP